MAPPLRTTTDRKELLQCDLVIEAIVENAQAKKAVTSSPSEMGFNKLFASNTSSISITRLAAAYRFPEKFIGMHFMNLVPIQPGCELIRGFLTSEQTLEDCYRFLPGTRERTDLAEDEAEFGINRMFVPIPLGSRKGRGGRHHEL